jgi:hypothetical protein
MFNSMICNGTIGATLRGKKLPCNTIRFIKLIFLLKYIHLHYYIVIFLFISYMCFFICAL